MPKFIYISYSLANKAQVKHLHSDLMKIGFNVLLDFRISVDDLWRPYAEKHIIESCGMILAMSSDAKNDLQVQQDTMTAKEHDIPIIGISWDNKVGDSKWIDFSNPEQYQEQLKELATRLYSILGINPESSDFRVQRALLQIVEQFPETRWIRIIHINGIGHPNYHYDTLEVNHHEDRFAPMSVVSLSLSERIATELALGKDKYTIIVGEDASHFLFPIGSGDTWKLSFSIHANVSVGEVIQYFVDKDYLAELIPLLDYKQS